MRVDPSGCRRGTGTSHLSPHCAKVEEKASPDAAQRNPSPRPFRRFRARRFRAVRAGRGLYDEAEWLLLRMRETLHAQFGSEVRAHSA
jgi:hypothetical protein